MAETRNNQLFFDWLTSNWLIVQMLSTLILGIGFVFANEPNPWIWICYGFCIVSWLVFVFFESRFPQTAAVLLAIGAVAAAAVTGPASDATAILVACVLLDRYMSLVTQSGIIQFGVFFASLVTTVVSCTLTGHPTVVLVSYCVLLVVVALLGLNQRQYRMRAEQAEELLVQRELTQQQQVRTAALDERTRIARELHDVLAHSLSALSVQLKLAEAQLEQGDRDGALTTVRKSNRLATEGMEEARNAVSALRADVPPLPIALAELVEQHRQDHAGAVELDIVGEPRPLSPATVVPLLRATREALTNSAKHAPGEPITVRFEFDADAVRITVRNRLSNTGSDTRSFGHGLTGMQERLALIGGTVEAGQQQDSQYWQVTAKAPDSPKNNGRPSPPIEVA